MFIYLFLLQNQSATAKLHDPNVSCVLENFDLWEQFSVHNTEMIVTRKGRRMFPVIKLKLTGLEPKSLYLLELEFQQTSGTRFKFANGDWIQGTFD